MEATEPSTGDEPPPKVNEATARAVRNGSSLGESPGGHALSGHTRCQKLLFAASLVSPMMCTSIVFFAKDVYILTFAADVQLMGSISTFLAVLGPCTQPIVGYCMEKLTLNWCFPWETWGRRAPWFLTHSVAAALATAAIVLPPSFDPTLLCWWYGVWSALDTWCLTVLFNAFESGRIEVYPTKEERSETEAVAKCSSGLGGSVGSGLLLVIAANASLPMLWFACATTLFAALFSLISLPVLRMARQPCNRDYIGSFFGEFLSLLRIPVVRHLMVYRFTEAVLTTTALNASIYYLTLVEGLAGAKRSLFLTLVAVVTGAITVVVLPPWTWFLRVRRNVNVGAVAGGIMALGAPGGLLLTLLRPALPKGMGFLAFTVLMQGTTTGQTFWRAIALGWVLDEDCHAEEGRRREAVLVGLTSFFGAVGGAVAVAIVILGLGFTGMDIANCDVLCSEIEREVASECIKACDARNFEEQPPAVQKYLQVVYLAVLPACQLICAVLTYTFPIKGARLDAIYDRQARKHSLPQ